MTPAETTPATPTNVAAVEVGTGQIHVTWNAMPAADTYDVQVSTDGSTWSSAGCG